MNEIERQRLIDGECDDQQRAELLASLGDDIVQWRQLALQLLEEQQLQKYFASDFGSTPADLIADRAQSSVELASRIDSHSPRPNRRNFSLAVLAATVLCMTMGAAAYYKNLLRGKALATGTQPVKPIATPALATTNSESDSMLQPVGRLQLSPSMGSNDVWETPVYEVSLLDPEMFVAEEASRLLQVNSQLNRRGWNANVDTTIYEGEMEDGSRMIFPVNVVRVEPLGY
jgi:hypothetical protein